MGAAILATPEMELDREESQKLADAVKEVGKHYSMLFDPKHVAIANLFAVSGFIYGPRIVAYRARKKAEKPQTVKPIAIDTRRVEPTPPRGNDKQGAESMIPVAQTTNGRTGAQMSPSQLWPEPAAEFPGLG